MALSGAVVFVTQNKRPDVLDQCHRVWDHHWDVLLGVGQVVKVHHHKLESVKFCLGQVNARPRRGVVGRRDAANLEDFFVRVDILALFQAHSALLIFR